VSRLSRKCGSLDLSQPYEYQESSWGGKGRTARKADNIAVICEPIV
jgi:hypothetical protein